MQVSCQEKPKLGDYSVIFLIIQLGDDDWKKAPLRMNGCFFLAIARPVESGSAVIPWVSRQGRRIILCVLSVSVVKKCHLFQNAPIISLPASSSTPRIWRSAVTLSHTDSKPPTCPWTGSEWSGPRVWKTRSGPRPS